jgi:hypothetical protein
MRAKESGCKASETLPKMPEFGCDLIAVLPLLIVIFNTSNPSAQCHQPINTSAQPHINQYHTSTTK